MVSWNSAKIPLPVDGDHGDGEQGDADVGVPQRRLEDAQHRWIGSKVFTGQIVIDTEGHHSHAAHHIGGAQTENDKVNNG